jgi:hypothetical protein
VGSASAEPAGVVSSLNTIALEGVCDFFLLLKSGMVLPQCFL